MILTDRQIREATQNGDIEIDPFDEDQVQAATYDLRIGDQGATTSTKKKVNIREAGYILIAPGDFGVIITLETIRLGHQNVARFGLRSKYARKGLIATTGPQIDPGYYGRLIVGVTNLTPKPISLAYKDDFLSVEFHRLEEPASNPYNGPYQGKMELGPEEIEFITESDGMAFSEVLTTLRSLSENVATLTTDVTAMTSEFKASKYVIPIVLTIAMAAITIVVALK